MIGWVQIALTLGLVFAAAFPMGKYMAAVFAGDRTLLTPVFAPVERGFYVLAGVDPKRGMGWKEYVFALLMLSVLHFLLLYAILRLQYYLPWNPQGIAGMLPRLAFNTAASFLTNTNWQAYAPESQISDGAQMLGLCVHMFLSAAAGIAAAVAVMRAFAGGGVKMLGNFYVDLTRGALYVLLPIVVVATVIFIASGMPQTLAPYASATTLEGASQTIALGPVAFQEAIKELGTNGGGFFNANSAHPFENPTALLLTLGVAGAYWAERSGNPMMAHLGVDPAMGNMEGKDVRFGVAASALFNVSATGTSTGAVNSFTDSYTPLGGLIPMFLMQLGEVTPGGVGSGLYTIVVFALLSVFVAGLMVGRTPEYLGKKVQAKEMKLAMLAVLILTICILGGAGVSLVLPNGLASLANAGPHGLSEMLYAWTSASENNGSAMAGITADTPLLDFGLGLAMLFGRFAFLVPVMAIAGSLAAKPKLPPSAGTFPTTGPLFVGLLIGVIIILGGLQFMPADALGPIAEHFVMNAGKTY
jgi:K+-transporting ATPase ATPase A chain